MSPNVAEILSRMESLSQNERAELAYAFLKSFGPEDTNSEAAFDAELHRRLDEIEAGVAEGLPAEVVFQQLRTRAR